MITVGFAGATSGLGPNIVEAVLAKKEYNVVVLSRSSKPEWSAKGIDVRPVDYSNHSALVKALEGVHTLISCVGGFDSVMFATTQLALIDAAKGARVRRFAPSEFAHTSYAGIDLYQPKAQVWEKVKSSGMEYTRFACGLFMNTLGAGTPLDETEALGGLRPWNFIINMKAGTADVPGDGNALVAFTTTRDIGAYVAGALGLENWDEDSIMVGDRLSYNDVIAIAERVTHRKFLVKYNSIPEMEELAKDPSMTFYNQVRIAIAKGDSDMQPNLNHRLPDVKPLKVEQFVEKYWTGVKLDEPAWTKDSIIA